MESSFTSFAVILNRLDRENPTTSGSAGWRLSSSQSDAQTRPLVVPGPISKDCTGLLRRWDAFHPMESNHIEGID